MSHLPFTLGAYLLNSITVLVDKYLLVEDIPNPLAYIFYISCFSLIAGIFLPFVSIPSFIVFILASVSTMLWTAGAYFMFSALRVGVASRVIPLIGTFIPLLLLSHAIVTASIDLQQIFGIMLLIFGIVFLTIPDWKGNITKRELLLELVSAVLFSFSYIALRYAYLQENFLVVLAWSRVILVPCIIAILLIPSLRMAIRIHRTKSYGLFTKVGALFFGGQMAGGASQLLLTFSVSLATPALVNSFQGVQYGFLYILNLLLSKNYPKVFAEETSKGIIFCKTVGLLFVAFGLAVVGIVQ